ncbi:MAG TPA: hypothetical protein VFI55_05790, partial [Mycobacterium sp.]|nr:hypothetical protein [Mycobacterium sp.]
DWEAAEEAPQSHRSYASGLVAAHLQWHLERQLKTLPLVERPYQADRASPSDQNPHGQDPHGRNPHIAERRAAPIGQDTACG